MSAETLTGEPPMTMLSCLLTRGGESTVPGLWFLRCVGGDDLGLLDGFTDPLLSDLGEGG